MGDPLTLAIAAAAAGKAVELTGQPVKDGIVAFGRKVRDKLSGRAADEEALVGAIARPDDGAGIARLAKALRRVMEADAASPTILRLHSSVPWTRTPSSASWLTIASGRPG